MSEQYGQVSACSAADSHNRCSLPAIVALDLQSLRRKGKPSNTAVKARAELEECVEANMPFC